MDHVVFFDRQWGIGRCVSYPPHIRVCLCVQNNQHRLILTWSQNCVSFQSLTAHFAQARSDAAATAAPATGAAGSTGSRQPGETLAQQFDAALDTALAPRVPTDSKRRLPSVAHKAVARASTVDVVDGTDAELEWVKLQSMLSAFGLAERLVFAAG